MDVLVALPENAFVAVFMAIVGVGAYLKRRAFVEWQLRHWADDPGTTVAWNLAHYIEAPPILMRGYDVTDSYAPAVPHRRYLAHNVNATPQDATLPRELLDYLDGRPPLRGAPRLAPAAHDAAVRVFADRGDWIHALAATAYVERRRQCVSADDANTVLLCLLDARKRHQAIKLFTGKYAQLPFPESTLARLMRESAAEQATLEIIVARAKAQSATLTPELIGGTLTAVSAGDWMAALALYDKFVPPTTRDVVDSGESKPPKPSAVAPLTATPAGILQGLAVNLVKGNAPERVVAAFLDDAAARWPTEYAPAILSIVDQPCARERAARALHSAAPASSSPSSSWALAAALARQQQNVPCAVAAVNHIVRHAGRQVAVAESIVAALRTSEDVGSALKALARPVAAQGNWRLAVDLARLGMRRKACDAVPALTHAVATRGHWAVALKLCTQAFTVRRAPPTAPEMGMCVHASVMCGRWAAALFWIERGHARGMRFAPSVYDATFSVTANAKWQASLRAYMGMAEVGAACTEQGVAAFVTGAASQQRGQAALNVLALADNVTWER